MCERLGVRVTERKGKRVCAVHRSFDLFCCMISVGPSGRLVKHFNCITVVNKETIDTVITFGNEWSKTCLRDVQIPII